MSVPAESWRLHYPKNSLLTFYKSIICALSMNSRDRSLLNRIRRQNKDVVIVERILQAKPVILRRLIPFRKKISKIVAFYTALRR